MVAYGPDFSAGVESLLVGYAMDGDWQVGSQISQPGDVNGDGYDDFVAGHMSFSFHPATIFYGGSSGFTSQHLYPPDVAWYRGAQVGMLPDADGDGMDEVLMGPPINVYGYPIPATVGTSPEEGYATPPYYSLPDEMHLLMGADIDADGLGELVTSDIDSDMLAVGGGAVYLFPLW
jgi:hypothetical protein